MEHFNTRRHRIEKEKSIGYVPKLRHFWQTRPTAISRIHDIDDLGWLRLTFDDSRWLKVTNKDIKWYKMTQLT